MGRLSASLRAVAGSGRIEFESNGLEAGVLPCVIRLTVGQEEWPLVHAHLLEEDRFELLAFFEDLVGFGDLPFAASVDCARPELPLAFEGSYPGGGGDVSLRIAGDWTRRRDLREAELLVALSQLRAFWPVFARVMHWPGYREADAR